MHEVTSVSLVCNFTIEGVGLFSPKLRLYSLFLTEHSRTFKVEYYFQSWKSTVDKRTKKSTTTFLPIKQLLITRLTPLKLTYLFLSYNFALWRLFFWEQSFSMIQFGEDEKWSACQKKFLPPSQPYGATFIPVKVFSCTLSLCTHQVFGDISFCLRAFCLCSILPTDFL
jgi:hypothetical protein